MRVLPEQRGPVDMAEVMRVLNSRLPADTTMTTGAGNAADWPNIHYDYRQFLGALAPISGAMGMGVPAAVAAKVARPYAPAVYIAGDGDFLMNGQELATAVQYGLDPIFIVIDNGMYGTIRTNQERKHPGRVSGTLLTNPDFAVVARGLAPMVSVWKQQLTSPPHWSGPWPRARPRSSMSGWPRQPGSQSDAG